MWWRGGRTSNLPDFTLSSQIRFVVAGNAPFATPAYPEGSRSRSIATVFLWIYSAWILHFAFCIFWSLFILWDAVLSPTKKDDVMHQQLECCETERVLERVQGEAELQLAFFFFFFSSSWLIKMLEGPAAGAAMTGENQLLYPLLFVGWAQNFGDFARFLVLLLQKEWQKGVEVRRL